MRTRIATALPKGYRPRARPAHDQPVCLTEELIVLFLREKERQGCTRDTLENYRRHLRQFYVDLPEGKAIGPDTLAKWQTVLLEQGYAARTVNNRISAVNSLLEYCNRWDLQAADVPLPETDLQPELTRNEYLRLLSTARMLGKERAYLLVKVFACMGLSVRELPRLTVEAVEENRLIISVDHLRRFVRIPAPLREELLHYVQRWGISSGPVFVARNGEKVNRSVVSGLIQSLAHDARVEPGKCNPRCLRKLYQATQENIQASMSLLIEQAHERLLEAEQLTIGWEEVNEHER